LRIKLHLRRISFHSSFYIFTGNLHSVDQNLLIDIPGISSKEAQIHFLYDIAIAKICYTFLETGEILQS